MSVFSLRNVLPVVTSIVATLFLATAVSHEPAFEVASMDVPAPAELQRCMADGRDTDACLDEADGKAVIEHAEWLARGDDPLRRVSR